jgi:hypothetical protein
MRTLTPAFALTALLSVLLLLGCGSDASRPIPAATTAARAHAVKAAQTTACPNHEGGTCLGALVPGTYKTQSFSPAITYTVPAGWTNQEDLPGNFQLLLAGDERFIGIYQNANAPDGCEEHPDPDVSQNVSDYTRWLRRNPLLHLTKPRPVAVGGLHGVVMDISKAPGTHGKGCTYDEFTGNAPFIVGGRGPAGLHHVIMDTPGWEERLYLLRYLGGNVAIEISPEGDSLDEYLDEVAPILRSLRFGKHSPATPPRGTSVNPGQDPYPTAHE